VGQLSENLACATVGYHYTGMKFIAWFLFLLALGHCTVAAPPHDGEKGKCGKLAQRKAWYVLYQVLVMPSLFNGLMTFF
jgi:hypothetical protein